MYNSLYVILNLTTIIYYIYARSSYPSHCLVHLHHHQPSTGHYLLRIDHSINNEQTCEHQCSVDHSCSMASFNKRFRRCHLFQNQPKNSMSQPYRSNSMFSTFANCLGRPSSTNIGQTSASNIHCNYDSLPWQSARRLRSIVIESYTLVGVSYLPCQELCSSVRICAGVQFQVRDSYRNRCHLLRSAKPWDLAPSKASTVFAKRLCRIQINQNDIFSGDDKPLCNFKYFGQGRHKHYQGMIRTFPHVPETQCQYLCTKIINCIGIEFVEKRSQCTLLSPNFLRNDGSIDVKSHRYHHIYLKMSCGSVTYTQPGSKCSSNDIHCGCHENPCQHGTCSSQQSEGYHYMRCSCYSGFTGQLCDQQTDNFCPCLNGGTCSNDRSGCQCSNGYYGDFCQIMSDVL